MAFDCMYRGLPIDGATQLTAAAIAACAGEHGLTSVYVVASVQVLPRRWKRRVVDVVVHMDDGDDILGAQFPDEAGRAVGAALASLVGVHGRWAR